MPAFAFTETFKLVLALVAGVLLLWVGQTVLSWKEAAQQNEQRGATIETTSAIIDDGAKADQEREQVDGDIATGRATYDNAYQEAKTNEPETAARADRTRPASVRNAFRERRRARERSGCIGDECESRSATTPVAER